MHRKSPHPAPYPASSFANHIGPILGPKFITHLDSHGIWLNLENCISLRFWCMSPFRYNAGQKRLQTEQHDAMSWGESYRRDTLGIGGINAIERLDLMSFVSKTHAEKQNSPNKPRPTDNPP
jgi:hypothetical protein